MGSTATAMDTLLLTVYFIVVFYVLYKMALSLEDKLEDKVVIVVDEKTLLEQTKEQLSSQKNAERFDARVKEVSFGKGKKKTKNTALLLVLDTDIEKPVDEENLKVQEKLKLSDEDLQEMLHEKIILRITPINKQKLIDVVFITVSINNDTANTQVYINWDRSSIEMSGQGNRTVRSTPNMPLDLSQPQVLTVVNPGMSVVSNVTTEKKYKRDPETNRVDMPEPLVDLKQQVALHKITDPNSDKENIQPLYTLDLMIGIKQRTDPDHQIVNVLVPFIFKMKIQVDQPAFPPIRWLVRHFGSRRLENGSWLWGRRPDKG